MTTYGEEKVQTTNSVMLAVKTVAGKKIRRVVIPVPVRLRPLAPVNEISHQYKGGFLFYLFLVEIYLFSFFFQ